MVDINGRKERVYGKGKEGRTSKGNLNTTLVPFYPRDRRDYSLSPLTHLNPYTTSTLCPFTTSVLHN